MTKCGTRILVLGKIYLSGSLAYAAAVLNASTFALPPSPYSHIVIETNQAVAHSMLILNNPHRVVLDLKNTAINNPLVMLSKKDFQNDVTIKQVRVGVFKADITRIVFDLKTEVKAVLNAYKPKDSNQYRLTLDFYPLQNKQNTAQQKNASPASVNADLSAAGTKSSGAKIILEPGDEDDEMQMDDYE